MVVHHLLGVVILLKQREELDNVGVLKRSVHQEVNPK